MVITGCDTGSGAGCGVGASTGGGGATTAAGGGAVTGSGFAGGADGSGSGFFALATIGRPVAAALDDSVLRKRCRTQGAALVSRYFSPSAIGEQLLDMYRFANEHPPA